MAEIISIDDFNNILNTHDTVLVDFFATWCKPCQMLGPVLEQLDGNVDFKIVKVDVDKYQELAAKYSVRSIPTLVVVKKGIEAKRNTGFMSKDEIIEFVK